MGQNDLNMISVLDKGYIRFVDCMGSDLTVVNAARVSYAKQSHELTNADKRLIHFLADNGHTSPFRHAMLQFEVYAPLMVARQWWKYVVGSDHSLDAWNESSRRYITETPEFYIPKAHEWRSKPENSKQGSGECIKYEKGQNFTYDLFALIEAGEKMYEDAIKAGICAEQARLFLPAYGLYVRWYWTTSLQAAAHFVSQRIEHDAQKEIQEYAKGVFYFLKERFPTAAGELVEQRGKEV